MKPWKWILGVLAAIGIGCITILTVNKFDTARLFKLLKEWVYLKDKGYSRDDTTIETPTGTVEIPEPLQHEYVEAIAQVTHEVSEGEILHEVHDRRNGTPIENNAKDVIRSKYE